jgi:hypothetical protein
VRYASASAFRQALETRLLSLSREQAVSMVRLRKQVAFDRLLARILLAAGASRIDGSGSPGPALSGRGTDLAMTFFRTWR